jgi:hypothetical protein
VIFAGKASLFILFCLVFLSSNRVSAEATANLVLNPSLEISSEATSTAPQNFSTGNWGVNQAVFTYPVIGPSGDPLDRAAKVVVVDYTDGDAKWYFDDVAATPGAQYVFADRYRSNVPADIVVRFTNNDGKYVYKYLGTPVVSANEWTGYTTLPFTPPENTVSMTVFHLIHQTGELSIDDMSLVKIADAQIESTGAIKSKNANGAVPLSYITGINTPTIRQTSAISSVSAGNIGKSIDDSLVVEKHAVLKEMPPEPILVASSNSEISGIGVPNEISFAKAQNEFTAEQKIGNGIPYSATERNPFYVIFIAAGTLLILGGASIYLFVIRMQ